MERREGEKRKVVGNDHGRHRPPSRFPLLASPPLRLSASPPLHLHFHNLFFLVLGQFADAGDELIGQFLNIREAVSFLIL